MKINYLPPSVVYHHFFHPVIYTQGFRIRCGHFVVMGRSIPSNTGFHYFPASRISVFAQAPITALSRANSATSILSPGRPPGRPPGSFPPPSYMLTHVNGTMFHFPSPPDTISLSSMHSASNVASSHDAPFLAMLHLIYIRATSNGIHYHVFPTISRAVSTRHPCTAISLYPLSSVAWPAQDPTTLINDGLVIPALLNGHLLPTHHRSIHLLTSNAPWCLPPGRPPETFAAHFAFPFGFFRFQLINHCLVPTLRDILSSQITVTSFHLSSTFFSSFTSITMPSKHQRSVAPTVSPNLRGTPNNRPRKNLNASTTPSKQTCTVQGTLPMLLARATVSPADVSFPGPPTLTATGSPPSPDSPPALTNKARVDVSASLSAASLNDPALMSDDTDTSPAPIVPMAEDERLILSDAQRKQRQINAASAMKCRVRTANASFQAQLPYVFHRDGYFKLTSASKALKARSNIWGGAIIPKHFSSVKPDNERDPKSIQDVVRRSVPSRFADVHHGQDWTSGSVQDFTTLATCFFDPKYPLLWRNEESGQRLRDCLIAFSKMSPETFGTKLYIPDTGSLLSAPETFVWIAANTALGSSWKLSKLPPPPSAKASVAFASTARQTASGTFAVRSTVISSHDSRDWHLQVTKPAPRKHQSFFTIALPALTTATKSLQSDEALEAFHEALTLMWNCDRQLSLYVSLCTSGPPKRLTNAPPSLSPSSQPWTVLHLPVVILNNSLINYTCEKIGALISGCTLGISATSLYLIRTSFALPLRPRIFYSGMMTSRLQKLRCVDGSLAPTGPSILNITVPL